MRRMYSTDADYRRMLASRRWRQLRAWKLGADPCCERCLLAGLYVPATEVHHKTPAMSATGMRREQLMFDRLNLESLCHDCHVAAHRTMDQNSPETAADRRRAELADFKERFGL